MKIFVTCLLFISVQIFPQTFMDVNYNNSDPVNSTNLSSISKITFSRTDITFMLTDNSSVTTALSVISKITFSSTDGGNPLPVELTSFTADVNGNKVILAWVTSTEVNNYGFEIERASSSTTPRQGWMKIGFVRGFGNSNSPKQYSYTDLIQTGTEFSYRLKQIDNDGEYRYSKVVSLTLNSPDKFVLKQNYPNPFNPATKISYSLPRYGFVTIKVYDVLGREVAALVNEYKKAGDYKVLFDGSRLSTGVYICRMNSADYTASIKMEIIK